MEIISAADESFKKRNRNILPIALIVLSLLFYLIVVPLLFPYLGGGIAGFIVIPIFVISWYTGSRGGIVVGLFGGLVVNSFMLVALYDEWVWNVLLKHHGVPGTIIVTVLAFGVGYFREMRDRYIQEIIQRRKISQQLGESSSKISKILQTIPSAVFTIDFDCRITMWNKTAEFITGLKEREVLGKSCHDIWDCPSCRDHCGLKDDSVSKPITGKEIDIYLPDGRKITVVKNVESLLDENGVFIGGVESFIEVTERKRMEQEIKETARGFQMLFNQSSEGLYLVDPKSGHFIEVNPAMCKITGYSRDELIKFPHEKLVLDEDRDEVRKHMLPLREGAALLDTEGRILQKDKSIRYVIYGATSIIWHGQQVLYGFLRDITSMKHMQITLERKNREIIDLTNTITHDLRNPLTGIRGIIELHCLGESKKNSLNTLALKQVDYMQNLINDLLEAAIIESDSRPLEFERVYLKELFEEIIELSEQHIDDKQVDFLLSLGAISIYVDRRAFVKVGMNLIGNAFTYRDSTRRLTIKVTAQDDGKQVTITIEDNGIGIPAEAIPIIFEKFKRGSNVGAIEGTGLGLSIVKGIIEAHTGEISVESIEGKGSSFSIILPQRYEI